MSFANTLEIRAKDAALEAADLLWRPGYNVEDTADEVDTLLTTAIQCVRLAAKLKYDGDDISDAYRREYVLTHSTLTREQCEDHLMGWLDLST